MSCSKNIAEARSTVAEKRADPGYAKKRATDLKRREKKQMDYESNFYEALLNGLAFHPRYQMEAARMAEMVCAHARTHWQRHRGRTERIPIENRATAAGIAWMRHATTAYDQLNIPLVKGRRRELAQQSKKVFSAYRKGLDIDQDFCPLSRALR